MNIFKMMKGRNLVNALGIPGWLFLIYKGDLFYSIFMLVCIGIALGEFYSLMEKKGAEPLRLLGMASSVFIADYYYVQPENTSHQVMGAIILIVLLACIWELFTPNLNPGQNLSATFFGILFVPVLLGTAIDLRQFDSYMGTNLTFAIVISVWVCDSFAFIFGTKFGDKKILPHISPKKSWVGSISGFLGSSIVFYIFYSNNILGDIFAVKDYVFLSIITGIFGQIGDFTESMLKRDAGVKDSGNILSGHGGVLDRFDSLIFAMPLTYLYVHFLM
jgi:phosphatidate cytidylyltransferase